MIGQDRGRQTGRLSALAVGFIASAVVVAMLAGGFAGETEAGKRRSTLSAVVAGTTGNLARGKGAVSSERTDVGQYTVVFTRNVVGCVYTATLGGIALPPGTVQVGDDAVIGGNTRAVLVRTFTLAGTATDRTFHLHVLC